MLIRYASAFDTLYFLNLQHERYWRIAGTSISLYVGMRHVPG
jgi:hypothetical protein